MLPIVHSEHSGQSDKHDPSVVPFSDVHDIGNMVRETCSFDFGVKLHRFTVLLVARLFN